MLLRASTQSYATKTGHSQIQFLTTKSESSHRTTKLKLRTSALVILELMQMQASRQIKANHLANTKLKL